MNKKLTPNQAWKSAVTQLKEEMPKATFDDHLGVTRFLGYTSSDNTFLVATPDAYTREWLEERLTTTARRLLSGLMMN